MPFGILAVALAALAVGVVRDGAQLSYPTTRRSDFSEKLFGVRIQDPYRWLEDANSEETKVWVKAENGVTFNYLKAIPQREAIVKRMTEIWNFERFELPEKVGSRYIYGRNDGLQNQSVIYVTDGLKGEPKVLLDPNTLSKDGTVALSGTSASDDGKYLAYSISKAGSDWQEWFVRDIETGKDMEDHVEWSKFCGAAMPNTRPLSSPPAITMIAWFPPTASNLQPPCNMHRQEAPQSSLGSKLQGGTGPGSQPPR